MVILYNIIRVIPFLVCKCHPLVDKETCLLRSCISAHTQIYPSAWYSPDSTNSSSPSSDAEKPGLQPRCGARDAVSRTRHRRTISTPLEHTWHLLSMSEDSGSLSILNDYRYPVAPDIVPCSNTGSGRKSRRSLFGSAQR
jgi:hypothetical protein